MATPTDLQPARGRSLVAVACASAVVTNVVLAAALWVVTGSLGQALLDLPPVLTILVMVVACNPKLRTIWPWLVVAVLLVTVTVTAAVDPLGLVARLQLPVVAQWMGAVVVAAAVLRQVFALLEERRLRPLLETRIASRVAALSRHEQQFAALVQHGSDVIVVLRENGRVDYVSPSAQHVLGYAPEELVEGGLTGIVFAEDHPRIMALLAMANRRPGASLTAEWRMQRSDGELRQVEVLIRNLSDEPAVGGLVLNLRDVTERKELEDQLRHQALHDDLTGLANRALLRLRIEQALARWLFQNEPFSLVVVDLDDFKAINDSLGHVAGDVVLKTVSSRIAQCTRRNDTIVRLAADEFAVLLDGVAAADDEAHTVAQRIIAAVQQPIRVDGHSLTLRASVGLACVTQQVSQADDIMRNADLALHTAKNTQRGGYVRFEVGMHDSALRRVELEADLRRALDQGELSIHYQPTVDLQSGQIDGVEALLRWNHPEKGLISPVDFIPVAEESGLIVAVGTWVLRQACADMARWQQMHSRASPLTLNVNLSGRQLDQPDIVEVVGRALADSALEPGSLVLEMTESVLMDNNPSTLAKMQALVDLGVDLAIDDFGTGYSSLSYLRQFPIKVLKIDRSFVSGVGAEGTDEETALVQAIVDLARTLQLRTVAEGIETIVQLERLRQMGCDVGQGYLLARPAPVEEITRLLSERQMAPVV